MSSFSVCTSSRPGGWLLSLYYHSRTEVKIAHLGYASPHLNAVALSQISDKPQTETRNILLRISAKCIHSLAISHSRSLHTRRTPWSTVRPCLFPVVSRQEATKSLLHQTPNQRLRDGKHQKVSGSPLAAATAVDVVFCCCCFCFTIVASICFWMLDDLKYTKRINIQQSCDKIKGLRLLKCSNLCNMNRVTSQWSLFSYRRSDSKWLQTCASMSVLELT